MSLKTPATKMSKSHPDPDSRILVTDPPDQIQRKVRLALTDSESGIWFDPVRRPGVSNLLNILLYLDPSASSVTEIASRYQGFGLKEFKDAVAHQITTTMSDFRVAHTRLMGSGHAERHLLEVAELGGQKARQRASRILQRVYTSIGL